MFILHSDVSSECRASHAGIECASIGTIGQGSIQHANPIGVIDRKIDGGLSGKLSPQIRMQPVYIYILFTVMNAKIYQVFLR